MIIDGNRNAMWQELITARKRSLGQGNIFAPVCHSVHRVVCVCVCSGGCLLPGGGGGSAGEGGVCTWGGCLVENPPTNFFFAFLFAFFSFFFTIQTHHGQWAGGTHPTGMHSCYYYNGHKARLDQSIRSDQSQLACLWNCKDVCWSFPPK